MYEWKPTQNTAKLEWGGEVPRCPTGCEFPARGADPLGTNCPSLRWDLPFFTNVHQKVPRFSRLFHMFGAIRASYHAGCTNFCFFVLRCSKSLQRVSNRITCAILLTRLLQSCYEVLLVLSSPIVEKWGPPLCWLLLGINGFLLISNGFPQKSNRFPIHFIRNR